MNLLITGGLGHIGSYLIRNYKKILKVESVTVIDSMLTQRYASLFRIAPENPIRFFEFDVKHLNPEHLLVENKIDCVLHLAALTDAAGTADRKNELTANNFESTSVIASLCLELGIPMIFPSTTSVYGSQEIEVFESCKQLNPQSAYAECKIMEEELLSDFYKKGLKGVTLRLGTIHGISEGMRFHTAVNKFCFQAANDLPITVWKTALHQVRPYLSLEDAGRAFSHVLSKPLFDGEIYNVLTSNNSVKDILEIIEKYSKKKCNIDFVESTIMNQLSYNVSNIKFRQTGFEFLGSLEQDISETIKLLAGIKNE